MHNNSCSHHEKYLLHIKIKHQHRKIVKNCKLRNSKTYYSIRPNTFVIVDISNANTLWDTQHSRHYRLLYLALTTRNEMSLISCTSAQQLSY